jgi:hypothetical protein
MSKLSKTVTVLVLVLILGLHWTILQSVAWLSMIVRYSQQYPLGQAIALTFDGQHPCAICIFVAQGRDQAHQEDAEQGITVQKLESVTCEPLAFICPAVAPERIRPLDFVPGERPEAPPTPPPRFA